MIARYTGYFQQGSRKLSYSIHDETFSHGFSKTLRAVSRLLHEKNFLAAPATVLPESRAHEPCFNTAGV